MTKYSPYRIQQLAVQAAIDSGDFNKASEIAMISPMVFARKPREPAQTGHNQTLTEPAERDIFYVIGWNFARIAKKIRRKKEMKTYDLIDKGKYIEVFNAGILEKTFNLSLSKSETIQNVKVIGKSGNMIMLRYVWYPETEHINHTAERFEKWIDENYTRA